MQNLIKKMFLFTSVLGVTAMLAGCTGMCPQKKARHVKPAPQTTEAVVFYQTYEDAAVNRVHAKMYTRSSRGGESKMGYIKFYETNSGLKMEVDLKDLRPGVTYTIRLYPCNACTNGMCCANTSMPIELPNLRIDHAGRLEEDFMIRGLTAAQLLNSKIYLERDGGYKAAWGTLEKNVL